MKYKICLVYMSVLRGGLGGLELRRRLRLERRRRRGEGGLRGGRRSLLKLRKRGGRGRDHLLGLQDVVVWEMT